MKTTPILRSDGSLVGFELDNTWLYLGTVKRVLRSVPGVANIKRVWFRDVRYYFQYQGTTCVVLEPYGDSSEYWIGPEDPDRCTADIRPLHTAFQGYRNPLIRILGATK